MDNVKGWNDLEELELIHKPVETDNNLLICDGNNIGFRYIMRSNYDSFEDEYIRTVSSLGKSYKASKIVVTFDYGKSHYRKALFDEYKARRELPTDPEELKRFEDFFKCLNRVAESLPFPTLKFYGVEADDLITYLTEKHSSKYNHTWIISSDKDILQLLDHNISIFNLFSRKEINPTTLETDTRLTPELYLLSKIIRGDNKGKSSDNIPGIDGIGDIRGADIALKYKTLENLISSLPIKGSKSQYIKNLNAGTEILLRNEKLINLKKYNYEAITAGADGAQILQKLEDRLNATV